MKVKSLILAATICGTVMNFSSCENEEMKSQLEKLEQQIAAQDYAALQKTLAVMQTQLADLQKEKGDSANQTDFAKMDSILNALQNSFENINEKDSTEIKKWQTEFDNFKTEIHRLIYGEPYIPEPQDSVPKAEPEPEPIIVESIRIVDYNGEDLDTISILNGIGNAFYVTCIPYDATDLGINYINYIYEKEKLDVWTFIENYNYINSIYVFSSKGGTEGEHKVYVTLGEGDNQKCDSIVIKVYLMPEKLKITNKTNKEPNYSQTPDTILNIGDKMKLNAIPFYRYNSPTIYNDSDIWRFKWLSSDPEIIFVNETGEIEVLNNNSETICISVIYENKIDNVNYNIYDNYYIKIRKRIVFTNLQKNNNNDSFIEDSLDDEENYIQFKKSIKDLQDNVKYNFTDYNADYYYKEEGRRNPFSGTLISGEFILYENGQRIKFNGIPDDETVEKVYTNDWTD